MPIVQCSEVLPGRLSLLRRITGWFRPSIRACLAGAPGGCCVSDALAPGRRGVGDRGAVEHTPVYLPVIMIVGVLMSTTACTYQQTPRSSDAGYAPVFKESAAGKPVVYQLFTRLFGNKTATNKPWGTLAENGVGKFNDINDASLTGLKELGVTHIWYTGVPHHAVITDYTRYGISNDDPDVVKGRAGSPYAIKDYYSVNPDLAENPGRRVEEFEALVDRTHRHGMKVIIDIVPNHVARGYDSLGKPHGVRDFGADDDTSAEYARDNNFYYLPGQSFIVPELPVKPLGGEPHPLADGRFDEHPARWTGNGSRVAQPDAWDWYETVKLNFGVRPDGTFDFPRLPPRYADLDYEAHDEFWQSRDVPDTWKKFRDIAFFWLDKGVDGFRYDVAFMVPVEFWSYLNSAIKMRKPDAFLLAELYQPELYQDFIELGKMDYLYDKVGLYDALYPILRGEADTRRLPEVQNELAHLDGRLVNFLENHDERRIASPGFAGSGERGKPGMVVSALMGSGPVMIYFGQELGEKAEGDPGFGGLEDGTRFDTTIFDYWGVPSIQRWMNGGAFDGARLRPDEAALRRFYRKLLNFSSSSRAVTGEYYDLHGVNLQTLGYREDMFSFARWRHDDRLIVVSNFNPTKGALFTLRIPSQLINQWQLADGNYPLQDSLNGRSAMLSVVDGEGEVGLRLTTLDSAVLSFER